MGPRFLFSSMTLRSWRGDYWALVKGTLVQFQWGRDLPVIESGHRKSTGTTTLTSFKGAMISRSWGRGSGVPKSRTSSRFKGAMTEKSWRGAGQATTTSQLLGLQ